MSDEETKDVTETTDTPEVQAPPVEEAPKAEPKPEPKIQILKADEIEALLKGNMKVLYRTENASKGTPWLEGFVVKAVEGYVKLNVLPNANAGTWFIASELAFRSIPHNI